MRNPSSRLQRGVGMWGRATCLTCASSRHSAFSSWRIMRPSTLDTSRASSPSAPAISRFLGASGPPGLWGGGRRVMQISAPSSQCSCLA